MWRLVLPVQFEKYRVRDWLAPCQNIRCEFACRTSELDYFRLTFPGSTFSKLFTISKIRASISSLRSPPAAAAKNARGGSLTRARAWRARRGACTCTNGRTGAALATTRRKDITGENGNVNVKIRKNGGVQSRLRTRLFQLAFLMYLRNCNYFPNHVEGIFGVSVSSLLPCGRDFGKLFISVRSGEKNRKYDESSIFYKGLELSLSVAESCTEAYAFQLN